MKAVTTAQATIIPAFQVRGMALLVFKLAAGEFDPTEDEEVVDVAYAAAGDTGVGVATGVEDV